MDNRKAPARNEPLNSDSVAATMSVLSLVPPLRIPSWLEQGLFPHPPQASIAPQFILMEQLIPQTHEPAIKGPLMITYLAPIHWPPLFGYRYPPSLSYQPASALISSTSQTVTSLHSLDCVPLLPSASRSRLSILPMQKPWSKGSSCRLMTQSHPYCSDDVHNSQSLIWCTDLTFV